ncbi:relaxase/mobilization nuclease domain-containing protein [Flavonifractor plautii]|uniref:relaxase/mobilization nuclease domain-containing protein n=1 Tax=Flavonifractor plautii TaxID=292800 RepID=UPI0018993A64|nr:relaxase/mobilization nuclease domain-containing protein [Flavonifractor plautii]MDC0821279.1 relaxase/mobilization nuclease domain-containing protein [Flavonifractor plautii]
MATCSFIKESKQTAGAMGRVLHYVSQEKKTVDLDGRKYLSGVNCGAEVAQQSFMVTKNLHGKASGTFFYHYVQSFSPQENVIPAEAHQISLELAERFFPGCEVLVATHVDAEHPHSHFVVNSVHPDTGKKLHFTPRTLEQMRAVSDQLCLEHGLSTLKPYQQNRRTKGLRTGEYRAAVRGESWKFQLITTVEAVMELAGSREEFIREMERRGYQVRWETTRKCITYTTPTGMKCRDDRLHEEKFRKEKMEHEFRIRQHAAQQRAGHAETATEDVRRAAHLDGAAAQHPLHHASPDGGTAGGCPAENPGAPGAHPGRDGHPGNQGKPEVTGHFAAADWMVERDQPPSSEVPSVSARDSLGNERTTGTGWESARRIYEAALRAGQGISRGWRGADEHLTEMGCPHHPEFRGGVPGDQHSGLPAADVTEDVLHLLARLEDNPREDVVDATMCRQHGDRKALAREQRKKIALGHKADDHEQGQQMG